MPKRVVVVAVVPNLLLCIRIEALRGLRRAPNGTLSGGHAASKRRGATESAGSRAAVLANQGKRRVFFGGVIGIVRRSRSGSHQLRAERRGGGHGPGRRARHHAGGIARRLRAEHLGGGVLPRHGFREGAALKRREVAPEPARPRPRAASREPVRTGGVANRRRGDATPRSSRDARPRRSPG